MNVEPGSMTTPSPVTDETAPSGEAHWVNWRGAVEGLDESVRVATEELAKHGVEDPAAVASSIMWLIGHDHLWKHIEAIRAALAPTPQPAVAEALEPFALISSEGVIPADAVGHVTVTTCAEYFHRAAEALAAIRQGGGACSHAHMRT